MRKLLFFILYSLFFCVGANAATYYVNPYDLHYSPTCQTILVGRVDITTLNGDIYNIPAVNSKGSGGFGRMSGCFDLDYILAANGSNFDVEGYWAVMVYDVNTKLVYYPTGYMDSRIPYHSSYIVRTGTTDAFGMYDGVPVGNNAPGLTQRDLKCSDDKASGRNLITQIGISFANGVDASSGFELSWLDGVGPCLYSTCKVGTPASGTFFDSSVCCIGGCPANQYGGDACNCTPCPTMVNKVGQTVSGTSDKNNNGRIEDCTMGTSHVFSDASGDWSFQPACQASN